MANLPRFTMDDLDKPFTPGPVTSDQVLLQHKKQERLLMKEKRLSKTEKRLADQQKLARERFEANQKLKEVQKEEDLRFELILALDAASEASGYNVNPIQRDFLVAFMLELKKSKVL